MEIRVLRYFLMVVREGGINRAAEVLHITQPTLSRQLSRLEEEVGVKLFHRGPRRVTLTNEGILLQRRAEEILSLVDRTEKELVEQEDLVEGRIHIGVLLEPIDMEKFDFICLEGRERWVVLMVQRGLAYSIAIEGSVPFWDREKITYRPLYPELKANSAFAWKKGQPFTLATDKFIEYLKCFLGISIEGEPSNERLSKAELEKWVEELK